ncbi:hypothetical protein D3C84_760060 [compost metagenome]
MAHPFLQRNADVWMAAEENCQVMWQVCRYRIVIGEDSDVVAHPTGEGREVIAHLFELSEATSSVL